MQSDRAVATHIVCHLKTVL